MLTATMLLTGCGEDSATCQIDVQTAIDKGEFDKAISKLEGECSDAFNENDRLYNLATAYMGKAGYSVSEIIKMTLDSADTEGDAFASFVDSIVKNKSDNSLELISKAKKAYLRSIDPNKKAVVLMNQYCKNSNVSALNNSRVSNVCFYVGFNQLVLASVTMSYLSDNIKDALKAISGTAGSVPDDMKATVDALAWAAGKPQPYPNNSNVNATPKTINGISYQHLVVDLNQSGKIYYRLADSAAPSSQSATIITNGYCDTNGDKTACADIEKPDGSIDTTKQQASSCYACPVIVDGNATTITEMLVNSLNDGVDSIVALTDDEDIKQSVNDFKNEVTNNNGTEITVDDIINYLNADN